MSPPTWIPGQVLLAADVNSWFVPLVARKPSDQTTISNTTLLSDSALLIPLAANATYWVETSVVFASASGTDYKFQWTVPAGATLLGAINYRNLTPADTVHGIFAAATVLSAAGSGSGTQLSFSAFGTLDTSSTTGNLQYQWAQSTSGAITTTTYARSAIIAWRIT